MNGQFIPPMNIVFEEDVPAERVAEFISVLSEYYGENIEVVSVNDLPPDSKKQEVA